MKAFTLMTAFIAVFSFSHSVKAESEEIKMTDLKNNQMRAPASAEPGEAQISPEQMAAMKAQIELIKENQKKSAELMKELEADL